MSENEIVAPVPVPAPLSLRDQVSSTAGGGFLESLRIIMGTSDIMKQEDSEARPGQWLLGKDKVLPKELPVFIGPWRYHAMRFKDNSVDVESFNLSPNSSFNPERNDWNHPDGFTQPYSDIKECVVPDNGMKLRNLCGFDILFYFPDIKKYGFYFIAGTAKTMPKPSIQDACIDNPNRLAYLGTRLHEGRNHSWYLPTIRLNVTVPEGHVWDEEVLKKFLDPGIIDPIMGTNLTSRPR